MARMQVVADILPEGTKCSSGAMVLDRMSLDLVERVRRLTQAAAKQLSVSRPGAVPFHSSPERG